MVEILICSTCLSEYDLHYKSDEVVSQSRCKCIKRIKLINGKKPLDYALEVLNEKPIRSTYQVSKERKANPEKQN
jgi:hypothetical protein